MNDAQKQHTPEPWHVGDTKNGVNFIYGVDGWAIAQCLQTKGKDEANARRIVACVNACAGIPTDRLEFHLSENVTLLAMLERGVTIKQQRDELLSALKQVNKCLLAALTGGKVKAYAASEAMTAANEAIANAEGGV